MKVGFIGAGDVAQTYAKYFVHSGHQVMLSNSRGPDSLKEIVQAIGLNVRAGTVQEAAEQEIVILAVRWEKAQQALAEVSDWNGKILVGATNRMPGEDTKGKTSGEVIAGYVPGAKVIKALNTLVVIWIPPQPDNKDKLVLFMSGNDKAAKQKLAQLLDESGFAAVDLGTLEEQGKLQDFGAPLSGLQMSLIKRMKS